MNMMKYYVTLTCKINCKMQDDLWFLQLIYDSFTIFIFLICKFSLMFFLWLNKNKNIEHFWFVEKNHRSSEHSEAFQIE